MGVITPPRVHSASSSCREVVAELEGSVAVQSPGPKLGGRRAGGARGAGLCGVSGIGVRTHGSTHRHADTGFACTLAGMRAQTCRTCTVACVLNMHAQTCAHAHTHAHARARTQPPASRVLSTRGQQTPTAARTRSPTPRLHTHAPSRVHANARTDPRVGARSHAQPTHTTPPPRPPNTACQRRGGEEAGGDTTGWDGEARGCREWVPGVAGGNADCAAAGGAVAERLRAVLRDLDVAHEAFAGGDGVSSPPTDADTDAAAAT